MPNRPGLTWATMSRRRGTTIGPPRCRGFFALEWRWTSENHALPPRVGAALRQEEARRLRGVRWTTGSAGGKSRLPEQRHVRTDVRDHPPVMIRNPSHGPPVEEADVRGVADVGPRGERPAGIAQCRQEAEPPARAQHPVAEGEL